MPVTPRERLARVLDGSRSPGAFSAQLSVPARDVRLTVAGAGPISFPVKAPQVKRMIASARPARFGRGERTLMDLSVRDTWEITPDQVTLTGLDWDAILAEVRDELGLPARARLRAEPHALLVYGKGQFFLPHQDSEKDDTMIGTLVVSLPSSHTGGELVIEHNNETVAYRASADEVSVAAFYADCRHERFLPECTFRGRQNTKFQYAVLAAAALHGGPNRTCSMRSPGGRPTTSGSTPCSRRSPTSAPPPAGRASRGARHARTWPRAPATQRHNDHCGTQPERSGVCPGPGRLFRGLAASPAPGGFVVRVVW